MKKITIICGILFMSFISHAQFIQNLFQKDTSYYKLHMGINAGGIFTGEGLHLSSSLSLGYRFTKRSAIGLEHRSFITWGIGGNGVGGLNIFYEYNRRIYYRGGIGLPFNASYYTDSVCSDVYEYQSKTGYYFFHTIGYHGKKGFTISLNFNKGIGFKFIGSYRQNGCFDETGPLVYENFVESFTAITLNFGYELRIFK